MVKESERIRAYHPRGPHKEDCLCVVCRPKGAEVASAVGVPTIVPSPPPTPKPSVVRAGELKQNEKFEFAGQLYRAGRGEEIIQGVSINSPGSPVISLGLNAKVKPVK